MAVNLLLAVHLAVFGSVVKAELNSNFTALNTVAYMGTVVTSGEKKALTTNIFVDVYMKNEFQGILRKGQ